MHRYAQDERDPEESQVVRGLPTIRSQRPLTVGDTHACWTNLLVPIQDACFRSLSNNPTENRLFLSSLSFFRETSHRQREVIRCLLHHRVACLSEISRGEKAPKRKNRDRKFVALSEGP